MRHLLFVFAMFVCGGTSAVSQQTASPATGQLDSLLPDPVLREAVRLATEGQGDSARSMVRRQMRGLSPGDPLLPPTLFAAGLVAANSDSATAYFRRLSIEFSRSEWADEALLRMSENAYANGELSAAARFSERVLLDYPFSRSLARAAFWAGRSRLELGEADRGCAHLRRAAESAGNDTELGNRAGYYLQRCGDTEASGQRADPQQGGSGRTVFTVQVAAVQSAAAADEMMQSLHRAGYEPHVVRDDDGLLKVRVGRFPTKAEAEQVLPALRRVVGSGPFVVEERR